MADERDEHPVLAGQVKRFSKPGVVAEVDHGCVAAGSVQEVELGEGELVVGIAVAAHECFEGVEGLRRELRETTDEVGTERGRFALGVGKDFGDGQAAEVTFE